MANKDQTKPKSSLKDKLLVPVASPGLKLLIMNVHGPSDGKGTSERRKQIIHDVIAHDSPNLVLFQEFGWKGISGKTWSEFPFEENYQYTGNTEASILYDTNELLLKEYSETTMRRILDEMRRKDGSVPTDFTPLPRMCARIVETKGVPKMKFICVAWHGRYSGLSEAKLVEEFKNIMKFFKLIVTKENLPIVIGGDFNIKITKIKEHVISPFKLYEYTPTKRRSGNVIDFYISTEDQVLEKLETVNISKVSKAERPLDILDHDPVKAMLKSAEKELGDLVAQYAKSPVTTLLLKR